MAMKINIEHPVFPSNLWNNVNRSQLGGHWVFQPGGLYVGFFSGTNTDIILILYVGFDPWGAQAVKRFMLQLHPQKWKNIAHVVDILDRILYQILANTRVTFILELKHEV